MKPNLNLLLGWPENLEFEFTDLGRFPDFPAWFNFEVINPVNGMKFFIKCFDFELINN